MPMSDYGLTLMIAACVCIIYGVLVSVFAAISFSSHKRRGERHAGSKVGLIIGLSFLAVGLIGMSFYHLAMEDSVKEATVILKVEPDASDDGWGGWIEKGYIDGDRGYLFDAHANSGDGYARSRTGSLADRTSFVLVDDESDESVLFVVHGTKRTFKDGSVSVLVGGIPAPSASNRMDPSKYDVVVFATKEALADAGIDAGDAVDVSESGLPERADEFRDIATGEIVTNWENDLG